MLNIFDSDRTLVWSHGPVITKWSEGLHWDNPKGLFIIYPINITRHIFAQCISLLGLLLGCLCLTELAFSAEFGAIELGGYALGSWPHDQNLFNQGTVVPASVQSGFGAGLTVGLFPTILRSMVGLAFDSNIHSGAFSASSIVNGRHSRTSRSDLLVVNTTANLILRYPGDLIRPYLGAGIGWTSGTLLNPNIFGRGDDDFDSAYALVHQFLGGAQVLLSAKVFLFGEYRYVSSNYHWEKLALDFRTHYGLFGVGLRF